MINHILYTHLYIVSGVRRKQGGMHGHGFGTYVFLVLLHHASHIFVSIAWWLPHIFLNCDGALFASLRLGIRQAWPNASGQGLVFIDLLDLPVFLSVFYN